jgi:hypothetical protein
MKKILVQDHLSIVLTNWHNKGADDGFLMTEKNIATGPLEYCFTVTDWHLKLPKVGRMHPHSAA